MNAARRNKLQEAVRLLDSASEIVDTVHDQESDCVDNYPENLQGTDAYQNMEDAVDNLDDAMTSIYEAKESIESAIGV